MSRKTLIAAHLAALLLTAQGSAYEVWLGTHKWEGAAADNLSQWDMAIDKIDGINYVLLDVRADRPAGAGANVTDWRTMIAPIDQTTPGMAEISRSQYAPASSRTLASRMDNEFATARANGDYEIDIIMLYDEAKDGTVWKYSLQDVQDVRSWLDSNGHSDVSIVFRLTNNDQERLALVQQSVIDGVLIEASATRWVEDRFNVHTLLQDLWTDPSTSYKNIYFQVPRHETPGTLSARNGIPTSPINQYIETRRALWAIKNLMGDAFMRSDRVTFIVCNYGDTFPTYPETASNDTLYVNSKSGTALSLIEQRPIFEGRTGVVDDALCASYDRFEVIAIPDSGLVAHWPLNAGSGTTAADVSGFGSDGTLELGATWASDGTRGTHVVFDGTNDRIATRFTYALSSSDPFTWAWWAKKTTPSGTDNGAIMVGNRYPQGAPGEDFEFIKFTPTGAQFANTDNAGQIGNYGYTVPTGEWKHYAMVKNGTSYQLYINGISSNSTDPTFTYNETSPIPFFMGGDIGGTSADHFQGGIDDVVLYRSALTPQEVNNVMNGIYLPIITMVALGTPVDSTAPATWSDNLAPHGGADYVIPATGNLRGATGTSVFPGSSLTVAAGGRFQVRAIESDVTTVDDLILEGGSSFSAGQFAELAAGTGTAVTNVIDGRITQSGTTRLLTFASSDRKLKIQSRIDGDGTLQVTGEGVVIDNLANNFSGIWEVTGGSTLVFENAGAVGSANVIVQSGGSLEIKGNWTRNAMLSVANGAGTEVKLGANKWKVASLILGGVQVPDGIYLPSELSGLGNVLFSGTGRLTVGSPIFSQEVLAGWAFWNSNTAPVANVAGSGITATATASTSSGTWSTIDDSSSGRGSSADTTWGSFDGVDRPASAATSGTGSNLTASNGVTTAELTLTITNNGEADWELDAFHMDVVAFRANAPRAYQLTVLSGGITHGVVSTSTDDEINELGGALSGTNDEHDDIDISLLGLADSTLKAGETAVIQIVFSSGTGAGGGHHLFLDNMAVSGVLNPVSELQEWRYQYFGTTENTGNAADSYDANDDGESNLLEFATAQSPNAATRTSTPLTRNGANLEFRYARSQAAIADGVTFQVEWSDTLVGSWSITGVTDTLDIANPGDSVVQNRIATIPPGIAGRRFVHLKVSQ